MAARVKWSWLDYRDSKQLLEALSAKAQQIHGDLETTFGVAAKGIEEKEKPREEGFVAIDLQDVTRTSVPTHG